jgi:hypothetical protein
MSLLLALDQDSKLKNEFLIGEQGKFPDLRYFAMLKTSKPQTIHLK